jgi:lipopolysaccharide/colanic/teichoic acid biosynthesis glycosyltransferase
VYYVKNYSMLLDIHILMKTVLVVFRGRGAY